MKIIGHRGQSKNLPENTLLSIQTALRVMDGVEFDVRLSEDLEAFVLHDETLLRTSSLHQPHFKDCDNLQEKLQTPVKKLNYKEVIKFVDVGGWKGVEFQGEYPPLIQTIKPPPNKIVFWDVKDNDLRLIDILKPKTPTTVYVGFSIIMMCALKQNYPQNKVFLNCEPLDSNEALATLKRVEKCNLDGINIECNPAIVNDVYVEEAKKKGLEVSVWCSEKHNSNIDFFRDVGVDYYITDG